MIQNDPDMLTAYGDDLCKFLNISGFKDMSAVDKLIQIVAISNGQPLNPIDGDGSSRIRTEHYDSVFNSLVGSGNREKIQLVHGLVTMPKNDLMKILKYSKFDAKLSQELVEHYTEEEIAI